MVQSFSTRREAQMRGILKPLLAVFALLLVVPGMLSAGPAPQPQAHPAYLHALTDLRTARAHLQRPDGGELRDQEKKAIHDIDEAINEIKKASIDDGKDLNDHPPVDSHMAWPAVCTALWNWSIRLARTSATKKIMDSRKACSSAPLTTSTRLITTSKRPSVWSGSPLRRKGTACRALLFFAGFCSLLVSYGNSVFSRAVVKSPPPKSTSRE